MEGQLLTWVSNVMREASEDNSVRQQLKALDFTHLNAPKELKKYSIDVSEGTNNSFKFSGNKLQITLSKNRALQKLNLSKGNKLSISALDSIAGGGTAYIGGISESNGSYAIDSYKLSAKDSDKNDGLTLVSQPDGSYVLFIANTKTAGAGTGAGSGGAGI